MAKRAKPAKSTNPRGRGAGTTPWWEQAEEVPRAGLPDAEQMSRRAKRWRWFVTASLVLTPLAMLTSIVAVSSTLSGPLPETTTVDSDEFSDTRPSAIVAVRAWLGQEPHPLPGGTFVGWHSATRQIQEAAPESGDDTVITEAHRLTVADAAGTLYDSYVSLGVPEAGAPVVIGTPGLMPRVPSGDTWEGPTWPGLETDAAGEEITAAVTAWANAYSSGDPAALRLVVGDDDASRNYMPLNGATLTEPLIEEIGKVWPSEATPAERAGDPATVVARARFQIVWPGAKRSRSERDADEAATVTYDLLIKKANTAAPIVVAWGGAGTGPALVPYSNALVGVEVVSPPSPTEATALAIAEDEASVTSSNRNRNNQDRNSNQ